MQASRRGVRRCIALPAQCTLLLTGIARRTEFDATPAELAIGGVRHHFREDGGAFSRALYGRVSRQGSPAHDYRALLAFGGGVLELDRGGGAVVDCGLASHPRSRGLPDLQPGQAFTATARRKSGNRRTHPGLPHEQAPGAAVFGANWENAT